MPIHRILVPVDFSPCSRTALAYAAELGGRLGASVDVLHVWDALYHHPIEAEPLAVFAHSELAREMESLLTDLERRGIDAKGRLESGSAREAIPRVAADGRYDLIVMGTHGRGGFAHLLLGSVAESVVRRAPCPVLTIRSSSETMDIADEPATQEEQTP